MGLSFKGYEAKVRLYLWDSKLVFTKRNHRLVKNPKCLRETVSELQKIPKSAGYVYGFAGTKKLIRGRWR
jgi:hypothetical protein